MMLDTLCVCPENTSFPFLIYSLKLDNLTEMNLMIQRKIAPSKLYLKKQKVMIQLEFFRSAFQVH